ncbi:AAA family ATPase [Holophaga foetida]|uniref:cytidylate kinase-like family protein n=1 Tax=Holophaga foetida TaxID=35839 RepID=UPI000247176A|nr:cytidylate kinase-like family protein [Holophaga foetida]
MAGWARIQEGARHLHEKRFRPTITLSREFGCEGFPLAERLKDLLENASGEPWNILDKALLERVAQDEGISLRLLRNLGDTTRLLESLGLNAADHVTHDKAFEKVAKHLVEIAAVGNAVIVGRGGSILCHSLKNCYHFRLEASLQWRIHSIAARLCLPEEEACELVRTNSRNREKFISESLGANVADLTYYDGVFNNERHTVEAIAEAILAYVKQAWADKSYFK